MALDESLFRKQIQKKDPHSILRFYRFDEPTLTIGYGMWRAANSSMEGGTQMIRRITGGGIVSHTPQDLTYSLIMPLDSTPSLKRAEDSYYLIHDLLKNSFKSLSLSAELYQTGDSNHGQKKISYCFDSPVLHDVMLEGKKIAGAGQKRSFGYLLHQGSIAWGEVLHVNPVALEQEFCGSFAGNLADAFKLSIREIGANKIKIEANG